MDELICCSVTGMGKGQHRMPSKDELVQRYNRMNTIPQVPPAGLALCGRHLLWDWFRLQRWVGTVGQGDRRALEGVRVRSVLQWDENGKPNAWFLLTGSGKVRFCGVAGSTGGSDANPVSGH